MKKKKCKCDCFSTIYPNVKKVTSLLPKKLAKWFQLFADDWLQKTEDLGYYRAILDGTWPSSEEILARALFRAVNKSKGNNQETK